MARFQSMLLRDRVAEGDDVSFRVELTGDVTAIEDIGVAWSVSCGGDVSMDDFVGVECPSGTVDATLGVYICKFHDYDEWRWCGGRC